MLRGHDHCSSQNETSSLGLVFTHYAYTFPHQVALKEHFYGYAGALAQWTKLSKLSFEGPMDVGLFLDWGTCLRMSSRFPILSQKSLDAND